MFFLLGKRVREARLEKGFTQEKLAKKLDVSIGFLSRVERGDACFNIKRLTQIGQILDIPLDYFITGSVPESEGYLVKEFNAILKKCSPEKQKLIYEIAQVVAEV